MGNTQIRSGEDGGREERERQLELDGIQWVRWEPSVKDTTRVTLRPLVIGDAELTIS